MNNEDMEGFGYQDGQRGSKGRGRGVPRATGRTRGGRGRGQRFMAREQPREPPKPNTVESIDINDSSQWPSIQESASGKLAKRRSRNERQSNNESQNQKAITPPAQSLEPVETNVGTQVGETQPSPNNYQNYSQPYIYQPRGRARPRYYPQQRNYQYNYPRRYSRYTNSYPPHAAYPIEPPMMNGYVANYPTPVSFDDRAKEFEAMRQVEYYFSVQNLSSDTFMRTRMDADGWVDLSLVFKFKRIQRLDMSYDDFLNAVVASDQLEVNKIDNRVRTIHNPRQWVLDETSLEKISNNNTTLSNVQQRPPRYYGTFNFMPQPYYAYGIPEPEIYYPYFAGMPPTYIDSSQQYYTSPVEENATINTQKNTQRIINIDHSRQADEVVTRLSELKVDSQSGNSVTPSVAPSV